MNDKDHGAPAARTASCGAVYRGPSFPAKHGALCTRSRGHEKLGSDFHWSACGLSWLTEKQKQRWRAARKAP